MPSLMVSCGAVVEKDGKILMVREHRAAEGEVLNQPVGKLELGEDAFEATQREVWEETGLRVALTHFLGTYVWLVENGNTSIRFCFIAEVVGGKLGVQIEDDEVIGPVWLSLEQLNQSSHLFRTPVTALCLNDYFAGIRYPLSAVRVLRDALTADTGELETHLP